MKTSIESEHAKEEARWPDGASAAISVTLDNMGEAYELEAGLWPPAEPIGRHFSVVRSLPKMLDILDSHNVRATYFIEAWNTDVYSDAISEVASRGHEVALHAFRHEPWSGIDHEREKELIDVSVKRFQGLGITLKGFRPPGGGLNAHTQRILSNYGIYYSSPAGKNVAMVSDHITLPFRWNWIDAFCYFEPLESIRRQNGYTGDLIDSRGFEAIIDACVSETVAQGGFASLLFHPFLHDDAERLAAMARIVERVAKDPRLWCAPCEEIADWVRSQPGMFGTDAGLISKSWMR